MKYFLDEGVVPPKPIYTPTPEFPEEARETGFGGADLFIRAIVTSKGRVDYIRMIQPYGYGFDLSAIRTLVKDWVFEPATYKGQPIDAEMNVEIIFMLEETSPYEYGVIDEIEFLGNISMNDYQLRSALETKAGGFSMLGKIEIEDTLRKLYVDHGYVQSHIGWLSNNRLWIYEGKQFRIGKLEIHDASVFSTERLLSLFDLKEGDIIDPLKLRNGIERIRNKKNRAHKD